MNRPTPDPSQSLGAPVARDPISGKVKTSRPTLKQIAHENGWTWRYFDDGVIYTKGNRQLAIHMYRSLICGVMLHEEGKGLGGEIGTTFTKRHNAEKVLTGTHCICPIVGPDWWRRIKPSDKCELEHPYDPDLELIERLTAEQAQHTPEVGKRKKEAIR